MARSIIKIPCPLCNIWERYYLLYFGKKNCPTCGDTKSIKVKTFIRNKRQ